ncbi:MAG: tyrosine-type recombinase/integrase [Thermoproteota archaeon]|nr:tyrosine-type recombinase/integrase [Thermoproteota archaeon]
MTELTWQNREKQKGSAVQLKNRPGHPLKCPECGSQKVWKDGLRHTEHGDIQRYLCRDCGRRFSANTKKDKRYRLTCQVSAGAKNLVRQLGQEKAGEPPEASEAKGRIIEYLWHLKKQGYAESTIKGRVKNLKSLIKNGANLLNPETVKECLAAHDQWSNGYKINMVNAYNCFVEMEGLEWTPPKYMRHQQLPFIPTEKELNELIACCGKKLGTFLLGLKETGADPGELHRIRWIDINKQSKTIVINHPVKRHNPRIISISETLLNRLELLPKTSERVFNQKQGTLRSNFWMQRHYAARKLGNPRLKEITFTTLRHWKATTLYHQTKDILYVKQFLGHKTLKSTMVYIDLEKAIYGNPKDEEFVTKVAESIEDAVELLNAGFEYVGNVHNAELFKKRK